LRAFVGRCSWVSISLSEPLVPVNYGFIVRSELSVNK
jgi:hypothetical protein